MAFSKRVSGIGLASSYSQATCHGLQKPYVVEEGSKGRRNAVAREEVTTVATASAVTTHATEPRPILGGAPSQ